ncbi:MAG: B12-binding domain-containing radical SAM protein [Deltaproteobacteria bacterium]|nr:B12-binding domain-containing radical SAM protein [Deltaproteobacteria bacterium]
MKVLLLAPPWGEIYGRYRSVTRSLNLNPPLNLAYLAATLARAGHEPAIVDLEFLPRRRGVVTDLLKRHAPGLVAITVTSPMLPVARRIAQTVGESGIPVVIGGPHVTLVGGEALREFPEAACAFAGEGEESFPAYVTSFERGEAATDIPGLLRRDAPERFDIPLVADLDALPEPFYPGVDFGAYPWSVKGRRKVPARTLVTSRGCPYRCVFCSVENLTGRKVRYRNVGLVVEEMERAVRETPARHFVFVDDFLTLRRERILDLSERLADKNLPITWEGDTRADRVDGELLRAMARAGCTRVNFGIESAEDRVLKTLKKKLDLSMVVESMRLAKEAGMDTRGTAMIGNPGDTRETIRKTVSFLRKLPYLDQPYLSIAQPYPGTELRRMVLANETNLKFIGGGLDDMRRYGGSVLRVGDIEPDEMVRIQRRAILGFYLTPRRLVYNLLRADLRDTLGMALGFLRAVALPGRATPEQPAFAS